MHAYPAVMRHVPQCRAARERAVAHPSGGNASLDAALALLGTARVGLKVRPSAPTLPSVVC